MAVTERDSVRLIPGVGEMAQAALERMGIRTIGELLQWYPRTYLDASSPLPIRQVPVGRLCAIRATVESVEVRRSKARGVPMLEVKASDQSGTITVRWFNQAFLKQKLVPGSSWIFIGVPAYFQGELQLASPLIEDIPHILSIYIQTKGITSKLLRGYLDWILKRAELSADPLPADMLQREHLLSRNQALSFIHQPQDLDEVELARQRLAFEEVCTFFVRMARSHRQEAGEAGIRIEMDVAYLKQLVSSLPFELTPGQKRAIWDTVQDLNSGRPMTRLLNGDVGSGKTVVAAIVSAMVAQSGYQSILLVPTEILARQHTASLTRLLAGAGIRVAAWTAALKEDIGEAQVVVGTHAVLQEGFALPRLAFVVIDEQHRFGVRQRQLLREGSAIPPHVLSMTATPIPRTLALALYGDLAVSLLPDKPKDRLPVITQIIYPQQRKELHERITSELKKGHQVFVICPLIEEKKPSNEGDEAELTLFADLREQAAVERKTVTTEVERLRKEHPEYGVIEAVHGKLKPAEKAAVMERMLAGEINVLVATSVIEVGVDIPNATVIVIEGAERFGLAQLHQFRGRVGRGKDQAYCFLCPGSRGVGVEQRLPVLVRSQSGFEVAEQDLALRGPGELVGSIQSGLPDFRMASLTDLPFLQRVKRVVEEEIAKNPSFIESYPDEGYSTLTGGLE